MATEFKDEIYGVSGRVTEAVPFCRTNSSIKDVNADLFIRLYAQHLKLHGKVTMPKWCTFVKTGKGKHLAPIDDDWYYMRAASILRKLYYKPDTGVCGLRKIYSCNQRRGVVPNHKSLASGKIIRTILQQFENLGFIEQNPQKKGRRLTEKGQNAVNSFARYINTKIHKLDKVKEEVKKQVNEEEEEENKAEEEN